jgi:cyclase
VTVPLIASGGAGGLEDFAAALTEGRADAVLAASRLHSEELSIRQIKEHLDAERVTVRL